MGEQVTEVAPAAETTDAAPDQQAEQPDTTDWKAEARKWEQRAKENRQAAAELEKARKAQMTEAERAIADAEKRGAQTAAQQYAQRLVRSEFTALARGRNPEYDVAAVLDDLNLARYVSEDGEPDGKALAAAVDRLVPAPERNPRPTGNADLGSRGSDRPHDMNALIRSHIR